MFIKNVINGRNKYNNIISHFIIYHYYIVGAYYNNVIIIVVTIIITIVRVGRIRHKIKSLNISPRGVVNPKSIENNTSKGMFGKRPSYAIVFFFNTVILYSDNIFPVRFLMNSITGRTHTHILFIFIKQKKIIIIYCACI